MLNIKFKTLKLTKDNLHMLSYHVREIKSEAIISSNIVVCMEDSEMDFDHDLSSIIKEGMNIATKEYEKR